MSSYYSIDGDRQWPLFSSASGLPRETTTHNKQTKPVSDNGWAWTGLGSASLMPWLMTDVLYCSNATDEVVCCSQVRTPAV